MFKDIALRKQCVIETLWVVYVTEPMNALCKLLRFWEQMWRFPRPTTTQDKPHICFCAC